MPLVNSLPLIRHAYDHGYAIPSFGVWSLEEMEVILRVAQKLQAPVLLMAGPGEFPLNSPENLGAAARWHSERCDVPFALHLDHGSSVAEVEQCASAGFTSLMLDQSALPFEENIAQTTQAAAVAARFGLPLEGELGSVGRADDTTVEGGHESSLTDPHLAAQFAERTGIDLLAVSIGNAHGLYTVLPKFDFERLAIIRRTVGVPLVLHGGSGTPEEDLKRAIGLGMAKVNVASELCRAYQTEYLKQYETKKPWLPIALAAAYQAMAPVVEKWIHRTGGVGQAKAVLAKAAVPA
ncbi:MAG: class II fructose-bisphosphate aldolase [Planctomycetota bacterium]